MSATPSAESLKYLERVMELVQERTERLKPLASATELQEAAFQRFRDVVDSLGHLRTASGKELITGVVTYTQPPRLRISVDPYGAGSTECDEWGCHRQAGVALRYTWWRVRRGGHELPNAVSEVWFDNEADWIDSFCRRVAELVDPSQFPVEPETPPLAKEVKTYRIFVEYECTNACTYLSEGTTPREAFEKWSNRPDEEDGAVESGNSPHNFYDPSDDYELDAVRMVDLETGEDVPDRDWVIG